MRPKKRILLVNANETGRRVQAFVLRTRGYRVVEAANVKAVGKLESLEFDLVVLVLMTARERDLAMGAWGAPVLAIVPAKLPMGGLAANALLPAKCSTLEFVESVRLLAMRKRVPKKAATAVPAMAEAS